MPTTETFWIYLLKKFFTKVGYLEEGDDLTTLDVAYIYQMLSVSSQR